MELELHTAPTPSSVDAKAQAGMTRFLQKALVFGLTGCFCFTSPVKAADSDGNFAIRGLGSFTCEQFIQTLESNPESGDDYAEWMSGYLSAMNRLESETFDASYVASNSGLVTLATRVCANNPNVRVEEALASLLELMEPAKVTTESELVRVALGERSLMIRQSVLNQLVGYLVEEGYLEQSRSFDNTVRDALIEFQQDRGLTVTGLPDFNTIVSAFAS